MEQKPEVTAYRIFSTIETDGLLKDSSGIYKKEVSWITPWSLAHLIGGSLFRGMGGSFIALLIFHSMYEYVQHTDPKATEKWRKGGYPWFYGDSIENSIGDTAMALLGWYIFDRVIRMGRKQTIIVSGVMLVLGYFFLSSKVQKAISSYRKKYMEEAYSLRYNEQKSKGRYLSFFGDKLPMPYALGLIIGLILFIMFLTNTYYPMIIA